MRRLNLNHVAYPWIEIHGYRQWSLRDHQSWALTVGVHALERFKKYCSHSALKNENAVFLVFGFVLTQLQGFANLRLRQSLAKNQKSSLRIGYSIF